MPRLKKPIYPQLSFIFTPQGFVCDVPRDENGNALIAEESREWFSSFEKNRLEALYQLGFLSKQSWFSPSMSFLHRISEFFFLHTVQQPEIEFLRGDARPSYDEQDLATLLLSLPFVAGSEFVNASWLDDLFDQLHAVYHAQLESWDGTVESYVTEHAQNLKVPEQIFFHLVENRAGAESGYPFAFVATYATEVDGAVRHFPLRFALEQYKENTDQLIRLIAKLSRAADASDLLSSFMESGELFHPLRLSQEEAYRFLKDVPLLEEAGILCRVPNWWKRGAAKARLNVRIGNKTPDALGAQALIDVSPSFLVDDVELTREDIERMLMQAEGLDLIKGKWVEVDHQRLRRLLKAFDDAASSRLSIFEAIREVSNENDDDNLIHVSRGVWLDRLLGRMCKPVQLDAYDEPKTLHATLRPYQKVGFTWLSYLNELGFGACLADDMGLGKTVQLIAFLERLRVDSSDGIRALLVLPASLLGNWQHELETFAPELDFDVLYGQTASNINEQWEQVPNDQIRTRLPTLCITTYTLAQKIEFLTRTTWDVLVLDEAQAIKNPSIKQTRSLKALNARFRIAMTGTPVENDLSNLWSVFDFLNPGLLGTLNEFKRSSSELESSAGGYGALRRTISPFLLRRLKTDRSIIQDLPEKIEIQQLVELSRSQIVLYQKVVNELERSLNVGDMPDIKRRGLVLATIMKLKQICNHPDQFLGQPGFDPKNSGKFQMLEELCGTIYAKRERVLVFTQFREMCEPIAQLLEHVFEQPGCIIHGQVPARKRTQIVERFQSEDYMPFMVLSLKAGGTGLNLTAANNVVHFDRWWNPAVENQATDRAFRIGQQKDVLVHKLICANTLEERIDEIITGKTKLIEEVVGEGETWLGNLTNDQIMELLRFK